MIYSMFSLDVLHKLFPKNPLQKYSLSSMGNFQISPGGIEIN